MGFLNLPPVIVKLQQVIEADQQPYLVGGAVRDLLLNREIRDIDIAVPGNALSIGRKIADALNGAYFPLDEERQTARIVIADERSRRIIVDVARFRGKTIEQDLGGRDFTINAMAFPLHHPETFLDPLNGLRDLREKKLRLCYPHAFLEDPVRMIRAIRIATSFNLMMEPVVIRQIKTHRDKLNVVSPERIRDEILHILESTRVILGLRLLNQLDLLELIFPEVTALKDVSQSAPHVSDAFNHTIACVDYLEKLLSVLGIQPEESQYANLVFGLVSLKLGRYRKDLAGYLSQEFVPSRDLKALLYLACLYHDVGKAQAVSRHDDGRVTFYHHESIGASLAKERMRSLKFSNDEAEWVAKVVENHMRPLHLAKAQKTMSKRAIYRFYRDCGDAGVAVNLISLADHLGTYQLNVHQDEWGHLVSVVRDLLSAWWEQRAERLYPPRLVNGTDLIQIFGMTPGPKIGALLDELAEAQAVGEIKTRDEALAYIRKLIDDEEE